MSKIDVELRDVEDRDAELLNVEIVITKNGIVIKPHGYGDHYSLDGDGEPILIEFCRGDLRVVLWPDINELDATIISMAGALEANRLETNDE